MWVGGQKKGEAGAAYHASKVRLMEVPSRQIYAESFI